MLSQLFIHNIAVIEKASIDLDRGFTVLTGETGAGKSIIIDAIHAVLGERTSKELVRTGAAAASVSALFTGLDEETLALLDQLSLPREEDGSLLIQRDIRLEGRSSCKVNGAPATVSMLKQLGPRLVTIHGQHESYELLSPEVHITYLDSYGELESLLREYQASYSALRETQRELEALQTDEGEKARLSDLLHYQIDEIEAADVHEGEREELEAQRNVIRNSEKIAEALELLRGLLSGDEEQEGLLAGISQASLEASRIAPYLPELEEASQKLQEAGYLLEDVDSILHNTSVEFDPALLESMEDRLDLLYKLGLKYGGSEEKILEFLEDCRSRLHQIEFSDEERERLEAQYEEEKKRAIPWQRSFPSAEKRPPLNLSARSRRSWLFSICPALSLRWKFSGCRCTIWGVTGCSFWFPPIRANRPSPCPKSPPAASFPELCWPSRRCFPARTGWTP